jgi:hypothetical protein
MNARIAIGVSASVWIACVVAACSTFVVEPSPPAGEYLVPVADFTGPSGAQLACAGGAFPGQLHGSAGDPRHVWMTYPDGSRAEIAWPAGYRARFDPALELLDASGRVVGREGSAIEGGCPTADPKVLRVELGPIGPNASGVT